MKKLAIFLPVIMMVFTVSAQTIWQVDKAHTNIGFSVRHMVVTDVVGNFREYEGTVTTPGDDFDNTSVEFVIKTASVSTDNEKRDNHLRSADFFDAEKNPEIRFKSKSFTNTSDNMFKIVGDLTIYGITREVVLDGIYKGQIKDPYGNTRAGFKATTTIDRYDYDMKYNSVMEAGGLVIGQNVDILIDIELIKK